MIPQIQSPFIFAVCQVGAEPALKQEWARLHPERKFAYSRPGFVTFKGPDSSADFASTSVFARAYGLSIGKLSLGGDSEGELLGRARELRPPGGKLRLHVFARERYLPGEEPKGFEPDAEAAAARSRILSLPGAADVFETEERAREGDVVFDVVLVEPAPTEEIWLGAHLHSDFAHSAWPGGKRPVVLPPDAPSRAFLKLEEAADRFSIPFRPGDIAVEIGSAPGGASLALLRRGVEVVGIDPGEMAPVVLEHRAPPFRHVQKSIVSVQPEELPRVVHWLLLDMNVEPRLGLFSAENLAGGFSGSLLGVLLTIKLNDWKFARHIPEYLERVARMGVSRIRAAQLSSNRREFMVFGLTRKGTLR